WGGCGAGFQGLDGGLEGFRVHAIPFAGAAAPIGLGSHIATHFAAVNTAVSAEPQRTIRFCLSRRPKTIGLSVRDGRPRKPRGLAKPGYSSVGISSSPSGNLTVKVEPLPTTLSTPIRPPSCSMISPPPPSP